MPISREIFLSAFRRLLPSRSAAPSTDRPAPTEAEIASWREAEFAKGEFLCQIVSPHIALFALLSTRRNKSRLCLPYNRFGEGNETPLMDSIIQRNRENGLEINDSNFAGKARKTWAKLGVGSGLAGRQTPQTIATFQGSGGNYVIHFLALEEVVPRQRGDNRITSAIEFAGVIEAAIPGTVITPINPKAFQQS